MNLSFSPQFRKMRNLFAIGRRIISHTRRLSNSYCRSDKTDKVVKVDLQYILPTSSPVAELDASSAFEGLSKQERLYAHYLSRASWYGGLICFLQVSALCKLILLTLTNVSGVSGRCFIVFTRVESFW